MFRNVERLPQKADGSTARHLLWYLKKWYKFYITHSTMKNNKKKEKESSTIERWPLFLKKKASKSQRQSNYYGFVRSRVGTRSPTVVRGTRFLVACCAKMVPQRCLFFNPANRKWHQKNNVVKVRHWDPLKTVLGSGFEKTWKIDEKLPENQLLEMV